MTEPLTITELDEETMAELQPPCEIPWPEPCPNAAEWAVVVVCPCDGQAETNLICDADYRNTVEFGLECLDCGGQQLRVISAVRL